MNHEGREFRVQSSALFMLVMVGIVTRWLYRGQYLEGWDSADFALALHEFDLEKYQPHFPGYPVYLALARGSQWVAGNEIISDTDALVLPGVVFGGLAVIPIALLAAYWTERYQTWAGFTAAGLYLMSPGLWLQAEKPLSDALGFTLLPWVLLALVVEPVFPPRVRGVPPLLRRSWLVGIAGLLMGLVLGVRLSYWPFVLGCALILIVQRPIRFKELALWGCGGLGIGTSLWLVPLIAHTGLSELIQEGVRFGTGHFTRWGGTVFSGEVGLGRYMTWWWGIWAFSLGGYWPEAPQNILRVLFSVSLCFLLLWGMLHKPIRQPLLIVGALLIPYIAWILIGQNPERPRHTLPLTLFLYPLAGVAVGSWMSRWTNTKLQSIAPTVGILAIICSGLIAFPLVRAYAETPPPQVAFVQHVKTHFDPEHTRIFTWETQRLFEYYAPEFNATRARGLNNIHDIVAETAFQGTVLFSSKLGQKLSKYYCFDYLTTFRRSTYVEPWFWTLSLFSYCGKTEKGGCCEA